jgi:UDP-glucuronate 4-epimerase
MKIFITGATGFIGSNLSSYFSHYDVKPHIRNELDLKTQLDLFQPEWIINCAAEIYDQNQMWSANVELTKSCLDWIKQNSLTKMIQIGSSSEYGPCDYPTSELDSIKAKDMYGVTKGIASKLCRVYAETYKLDVVVVRPYSPYGPGERPHRLFPKLWQSFKLNRPMQLVNGVHDFCYIDDFVKAIDVIMNSKNRIPGDYINVSSGVQTTNKEVYDYFKNITGLKGAVTLIDKFCTPKVWQANISHVQHHYGWNPTTSVEDGIRQFLIKANYE